MYKHILAATDFSDLGDHALRKAAELAILHGAKLTFVHVKVSEDSASPMYAQHEVQAQVAQLEDERARANTALSARVPATAKHIKVDFEVRLGEAGAELLAAMETHDADLLVISSNGERGFREWLLGTTTERVVRGARRDVLVVT